MTDILWHNSSTNETQIWFLEGHRLTQWATVVDERNSNIFVGPPWSIVGTGDLDLSGGADIVCHNNISNETQIWRLEGRRVIGRKTVADNNGSILVGSPWNIVGTGRFGDDIDTGIVWYNRSTGETQVWLMRNLSLQVTGRATVVDENDSPIFVGPPWSIVGVHGQKIVWHNGSTNETQIWFLNRHRVTSRATVVDENDSPIFVGPPWSIVGVHEREIVWHNSSTNETKIWFLENQRLSSQETVVDEKDSPIFVGPPWSIVGTNRFLRDQ